MLRGGRTPLWLTSPPSEDVNQHKRSRKLQHRPPHHRFYIPVWWTLYQPWTRLQQHPLTKETCPDLRWSILIQLVLAGLDSGLSVPGTKPQKYILMKKFDIKYESQRSPHRSRTVTKNVMVINSELQSRSVTVRRSPLLLGSHPDTLPEALSKLTIIPVDV